MAVPLYGMTLKCSKCGVVSSAEVSATATSNAMLVPLISTSFLSFFPLSFFFFFLFNFVLIFAFQFVFYFPLPFPCTHQPVFIFSPHVPAHLPDIPQLSLTSFCGPWVVQGSWNTPGADGLDPEKCFLTCLDFRFKHVSSPWKTKGLCICCKLCICLMPCSWSSRLKDVIPSNSGGRQGLQNPSFAWVFSSRGCRALSVV